MEQKLTTADGKIQINETLNTQPPRYIVYFLLCPRLVALCKEQTAVLPAGGSGLLARGKQHINTGPWNPSMQPNPSFKLGMVARMTLPFKTCQKVHYVKMNPAGVMRKRC
jgi:hypothetical protein